jgi:hypothetical protein
MIMTMTAPSVLRRLRFDSGVLHIVVVDYRFAEKKIILSLAVVKLIFFQWFLINIVFLTSIPPFLSPYWYSI